MTTYLAGYTNGLAFILGLAALVATFLLLTVAWVAVDKAAARRASRRIIEPTEYEGSAYRHDR